MPTLHQISIPPLIAGLQHLEGFIAIAEAHLAKEGLAEADLVQARLYDDMAPFSGQVQRASDTARFLVTRLGAGAPLAMPDTEQSFAELRARIEATIAYLEQADAAAIDASEDKAVTLKAGASERDFTGASYVLTFALPNFYFHLTTAYDVLRHRGVPLGKLDFLGWR